MMYKQRILGFDLSMFFQSAIHFISLLIGLVFIGLIIYCLILFIKLATRGIKALDIYNNLHGKNREK